MYYRIKENKVYDFSNEKYLEDCLETDLCTAEEYSQNIGKYIVGEVEQEIDVPDYETVLDEEGNEFQEQTGTHKETIMTAGLVLNPNWEMIKEQKEKERIGNLKVTKRVFALALQQLGLSYTRLKEAIATNEQAQLEWDLCVELERKNPLLDAMAEQLGYTSNDIDNIFIKANM